MKKDYTHISVILDRSGSMNSIKTEVIGGFNSFLEIQQKDEEQATLTLVQFDSANPYEVIHSFKPLKEIPKLTANTFVPRGLTPLLDAIGRGILDVNSFIKTLDKKERPEKVVFVIITDGQENNSREFTKARVTDLIKKKTEKKNWQFVFLSADLNAIEDAKGYGISAKATASYMSNGFLFHRVFEEASSEVSSYRKSLKDKIELKKDEDK